MPGLAEEGYAEGAFVDGLLDMLQGNLEIFHRDARRDTRIYDEVGVRAWFASEMRWTRGLGLHLRGGGCAGLVCKADGLGLACVTPTGGAVGFTSARGTLLVLLIAGLFVQAIELFRQHAYSLRRQIVCGTSSERRRLVNSYMQARSWTHATGSY